MGARAVYLASVMQACLLLFPLARAADAAWSYEGIDGPSNWASSYPNCGKTSQSPINIYDGDVKVTNMAPFNLVNYDTTAGVDMTLLNNGHSVQVSVEGTTAITASGGGLQGEFKVAQFHFHWGSDDKSGSEHLFNTQAYPMELHIVHYNTKYPDIGTAVSQPDGLAVLGFMFEVSATANQAYASIVSGMSSIQTKDDNVALTAMPLQSLIPSNLQDFYRYSGSLTTPGCDESVTWTVFKSTIKISEEQLSAFRLARDNFGNIIVDNYRPVQPYNSRVVEASFDPHSQWGYLDNGADRWSDSYQMCGGTSQSPVNIASAASELDLAMSGFQYYKYDSVEGITMELSNNGHSAQVTYTAGDVAINGGGLRETYTAAQFHLHWGSVISQGSEHLLDGSSYPAELHVVHYKTSLKSLGDAAAVPEGLAVLGFFLEVSDADNEALKPFIDALTNVRDPGSTYTMPTAFTLDSILPADRMNFFRYSGSLTTPGCYESVIWTVFTATIPISNNQLTALRQLKSSEKNRGVNVQLVDNYRPVQPLNNRVIKRTFQITKPYWTYEGPKGVNFWYQDYPKCESTANSAQSPINIVDTEATYQNLQPIVFAGYSESQGIEWELSNNGHSVVASVISGELLIFGGGFSDNYEAAQFHFHWGASSGQGSEHLINGGAYPLELHIVHRGANYKSVSEAAVQPNGLAVLGFMFEISPIDNSNLDPIINNLANIVNPGDKKALPPVTLRDFLPRSLTDFYRYSGSLTTPGCYESVTWTVFRNTIPISESQLQKFRQVKSNDRNQTTNEYMPMVNNFRPVQPINSRVVFANFKLTPDAAVGLRGNLVIYSLCLLVLSIFSAV